MAKSFRVQVMTLLAVCLVGLSSGCASVKDAIHGATAPTPAASAAKAAAAPAAKAAAAPASAAVPAAKAASAAVAAMPSASAPTPAAAASASGSSITEQAVGPTSVQAPFPTSKNKPQGQAWTVMKDGGYTGGLKTASQLMGLTAKQLALYESKQKAADFVTMTVPNGVVLDRLTFTRDGKHQVDIGAKVELDNPTTRLVDVYDLGGGLIVMRFHGCNNYALVRGWTQSLKPQPAPATAPAPVAKAATPAPQPAPAAGCAIRSYVQVHIWNADAVNQPGVQATVTAATTRPDNYFGPDSLSRRHGAQLSSTGTSSTVGQVVTLNLLKADGAVRLIEVKEVVGKHTFKIPADFAQGDVLQALFDSSKVVSPNDGDLRARWEEFLWCTSRMHAIEVRMRR